MERPDPFTSCVVAAAVALMCRWANVGEYALPDAGSVAVHYRTKSR